VKFFNRVRNCSLLGALGSAKVQGTLPEAEDELFKILTFGLEPANAVSLFEQDMQSLIDFNNW